MLDEARTTCRDAAEDARRRAHPARIGSAATVAAVERLARADRRHAASADQWDADPWLLNTPGGTVDLRTGALRAAPARRLHHQDDRGGARRRLPAVSRLPRAHLRRRRGADRLRAAGARLRAHRRDRASTRCSSPTAPAATARACCSTPSRASSAATRRWRRWTRFTAAAATRAIRPSSPCCAARASSSAQETEHGRALGRGAHQGADRRRPDRRAHDARRLLHLPAALQAVHRRQPQARHSLRRRGDPPALQAHPVRRDHPADAADRALPRKLEAEWPGILAWMIAGCREWQRMRPRPAAAVTAATADYLAEEDTFGAWLDEWVRAAPGRRHRDAPPTSSRRGSPTPQRAQEPAGSTKAFGRAHAGARLRAVPHRQRGRQGLQGPAPGCRNRSSELRRSVTIGHQPDARACRRPTLIAPRRAPRWLKIASGPRRLRRGGPSARPAGRRPAMAAPARSAGFARAGGPSWVDRKAIHPTRPYECGESARSGRALLAPVAGTALPTRVVGGGRRSLL